MRDNEGAELEKLGGNDGRFLGGNQDAGVQVALLADCCEERVGESGGGTGVGEVLKVGYNLGK